MSPFDRTEEVLAGLRTMSDDTEQRSRTRIALGKVPAFEAGIQLGLIAAKCLLEGATPQQAWDKVDALTVMWMAAEQKLQQ